MRRTKEQERERRIMRACSICKHYIHETQALKCPAGVDLFSVRHYGPESGGFYKLPCWSPEIDNCPKREYITREEAEAAELADEKFHEQMKEVRSAISVAAGGEPGRGFISCPICTTGRLSWSIASNFHASATCSTKGCVCFIE